MRNDDARNVYGASVSTTATEAMRPASQVGAHLSALVDSLCRLEKQIELLSDRLKPVTRSEVPASVNAKAAPDEALVPVADQLRNLDRQAISLRVRLESLTDRVEA
jgi:hypothetical protein